MSKYVVDAGVAVKWFLEEVCTDEASRLLTPRFQLLAPDLLLLEIDTVLCRRVRRGELSTEEAQEIRSAMRSFPIETHPFRLLMDAAFEIASLNQCSVYDCMYLVLAMLMGARMVTADRHFYNTLSTAPFSDYLCWVEDLP